MANRESVAKGNPELIGGERAQGDQTVSQTPRFQRSLLGVQRTLGNRAARSLIEGGLVQPKLRVGPAADSFEREADRMADSIDEETKSPGPAGTRATASTPPAHVQPKCRECEQEEEDEMRRKARPGAPRSAPAGFESRLLSLRGKGTPLASATRRFFEPRFSRDFGDVRIHRGAEAADAARSIGARAFTAGADIVFDSGEYSPENRSGKRLLAHELTHVAQQGGADGATVRRQPQPGAERRREVEVGRRQEDDEANRASPPTSNGLVGEPRAQGAPSFLVEDESPGSGPGRMTKSEFLVALRESVCSTADQAFEGTDRTSQGCPWIEMSLRFYERQSAARIERDLIEYAPEAAGARSASDYLPIVAAHVRESVQVWLEKGVITGIPPGLPGTGLLGLVGGAALGLGGLFFKSRPGGPRTPAGTPAPTDRLGGGAPLQDSVRDRMQSAFGRPFSGVRVHSDPAAARLAGRYNARAMTIGEHVAFGAGEYRPGNPVGDALIAHELAHVVQQREAPAEEGQQGARDQALEREADSSALGAVTSIWGGFPEGAGRLNGNLLPRLRTGLRLQSCKSEEEKEIDRLAALQKDFLVENARKEKLKKLEKERKKEIEARKKRGEKDVNLPPINEKDIKVDEKDLKKQMSDAVNRHTKPDKKPTRWEAEEKKDGGKSYTEFAKKTIEKVKTFMETTKGFEDIAELLRRSPPEFSPESARTGLEKGWFGWASGDKFNVSMSWIDNADREPKSAASNIAHEIGGHVYYGKTLSKKISDVVLDNLDDDLKKSLVGTAEKRQDFADTYTYPETELFSEIRERRYARTIPESTGGDDPDVNIPELIQQIRDTWQPEVARKILTRVWETAKKAKEIRQEDVDFFLAQVEKEMGYKLQEAPATSGSK